MYAISESVFVKWVIIELTVFVKYASKCLLNVSVTSELVFVNCVS